MARERTGGYWTEWAVRFSVSTAGVDDDSVDLTLAGQVVEGVPSRPKIDVQLKCTSEDVLREREVVYPLKRKNNNELTITIRRPDRQDCHPHDRWRPVGASRSFSAATTYRRACDAHRDEKRVAVTGIIHHDIKIRVYDLSEAEDFQVLHDEYAVPTAC